MKHYQITGWSIFAIVLAGCASKPAPELYFLDYPGANEKEQQYQEHVGLAQVILPSYARKDKIASLVNRHRIFQDDDHRWAEPPEEAVSVAFTRALESRLNRSVLLQPYPRALAPTLQIKIVFDRFLRGFRGQAELSGQYLLLTGNGDKVIAVSRFQFSVPVDTTEYTSFMEAVVRSINLVSDRIAADVAAHS